MTLQEAWKQGAEKLRSAGIEEAALDAWYLLEYVTGIRRGDYFMDPEKRLDPEWEREYLSLLEKRAGRIPLQHLTGVQEFMGLEFLVQEHVLIPRQDTETVVECVLKMLEDRQKKSEISGEGKPDSPKILDLCTGSGCILLSILKLAKQAVCGIGTDLSEQALVVAGKNAEKLGIETVFLQSDLFEKVEGKFSIIVSNPPYIRTADIRKLQEEVRYHDPIQALDGGKDGLCFYRRIIAQSPDYLLPGGMLVLEIGYDQAEDVTELMQNAGFKEISVKKDLAGLDRAVSGMYDKTVPSKSGREHTERMEDYV